MDLSESFDSVPYGPSVVYWGGELDLATREFAERSLQEAAEGGGLITIDMSNVTFMDSTGLHVIVHAVQAMPSGCIVLHGVGPSVAHVLEQTGITRHPRIHMIPCLEDPFPEGGKLRDNGTNNELYQRILAMKARHQEIVARTKLELVRRKRWSEHVSARTAERRQATEGRLAHVAARRAWIDAALSRVAA